MRDGGSVATFVCDDDRLVISCSHYLMNPLNGTWKAKGKTEDGPGWL